MPPPAPPTETGKFAACWKPGCATSRSRWVNPHSPARRSIPKGRWEDLVSEDRCAVTPNPQLPRGNALLV